MSGTAPAGKVIKFRRPTFVHGLRETNSESLGSTSGTIERYGVTLITATATGLVYQLPSPVAGEHKRVVLDYAGATGNLTIANPTTADFFNGSTANVITVSSSEEHAVFDFIGLSTSAWSVSWSAKPTTAAWGITFAASTVTS